MWGWGMEGSAVWRGVGGLGSLCWFLARLMRGVTPLRKSGWSGCATTRRSGSCRLGSGGSGGRGGVWRTVG